MIRGQTERVDPSEKVVNRQRSVKSVNTAHRRTVDGSPSDVPFLAASLELVEVAATQLISSYSF